MSDKDDLIQCPKCDIFSEKLSFCGYCEHCGQFNRGRWKDRMKNEHLGLSAAVLFSFFCAVILLFINNFFDLIDKIEPILTGYVPEDSIENYAWLTLLVCALIAGCLISLIADKINLRDWEPAKSPRRARRVRNKWRMNQKAVILNILTNAKNPRIKISALPYFKDDEALLRKLFREETSTALRKEILKLLSTDKELVKSVILSDTNQKLRKESLEFLNESELLDIIEHDHTAEIEKAILNTLSHGRNEIVELLQKNLSESSKLELVSQIEDMETLADLKEIIHEPSILTALDTRIVELRDHYIKALWKNINKHEITAADILDMIKKERLRAVQKGIIARVSDKDVLNEISQSDIDPVLKKTSEDRIVKLNEEEKKTEERRLAKEDEKRKAAAEKALEKKAAAAHYASLKIPGVVVYTPNFASMKQTEAVTAIMMFALQSGNAHLMMDSIPKFTMSLFGELSGETIVEKSYNRFAQREGWRPITPQIQFAFKEGVAQYAIAFPSAADVLVINNNRNPSSEEQFSNADAESVKNLLDNLGENAKKSGATGIWSWTDSRSGKEKYVVFHSTSESNEFEFEAPDYVSNKVQFWERGSFSAAGRTFVDGPDWAAKDQKELDAARGCELEKQLFEAIDSEDVESVKTLLTKGASPNAKGGTWNDPALLAAGQKNNPAIVEALLNAGADPSGAANSGWPILAELISGTRDFLVIKALVEAGSDVNLKAPTGVSLLDIAEARGSQDVIALLKKHGAR